MNPELTYTLELARSLDRFIRGVDASQEKVFDSDGCNLAFSRAIKRGKEAVISMLQKACCDLATIEGGESGKFIRALEYGEIPAGDFFSHHEVYEGDEAKNGTTDVTDEKFLNRGRGVGARSPSRRQVVRSNRIARSKTAKSSTDRADSRRSKTPKSVREFGRRKSVDQNSVEIDDEKSEEVMAQWR